MHSLLHRLLLSVLVLAGLSLGAQSWSVAPVMGYGRPLGVSDFLRGENYLATKMDRFGVAGLEVRIAPDTISAWQQRYGLPRTALAVRYIDFYNKAEIGRPLGVLRTFGGPFRRRDRWSFDYVSAVGLSYGWQRYDYFSNDLNTHMSTRLAAYVQLGLGLTFNLGERFELAGDLSLHHFSNGNFKRPNTGLNAVAASIGLRYRPQRFREHPVGELAPPLERRTAYVLTLYGGVENRLYYPDGLPPENRNSGLIHPVAGLSVSRERRLNHKSSFGFGASVVYRTTGPVEVRLENGRPARVETGFRRENIRFGIFPVYVQHFGRIDVLVQAEYYLYRNDWPSQLKRMNQKLGFRYRLGDRILAGVVVNARQFTIADFVEWQLGYNLSGCR